MPNNYRHLGEGDYPQGGGGPFATLRSYLLAKLLWQPVVTMVLLPRDRCRCPGSAMSASSNRSCVEHQHCTIMFLFHLSTSRQRGHAFASSFADCSISPLWHGWWLGAPKRVDRHRCLHPISQTFAFLVRRGVKLRGRRRSSPRGSPASGAGASPRIYKTGRCSLGIQLADPHVLIGAVIGGTLYEEKTLYSVDGCWISRHDSTCSERTSNLHIWFYP